MALDIYRKKRKFGVTAEPRGHKGRAGGNRYVIQKHDASRLHYDLRLELDGVMKSWAVTRGPSLDPGEKRLAVHVEDHPIEYNTFEGTIPEGEYGGGTVMIWDRGRWIPDGDPHQGYAKGHLDFDLDGEKLHGRWHLVRMRPRPGERARELAADQRQGRSGAQRPRRGYFGRRAAVGRQRPHDGRDRRRQRARNGSGTAIAPCRIRCRAAPDPARVQGAIEGGSGKPAKSPANKSSPSPKLQRSLDAESHSGVHQARQEIAGAKLQSRAKMPRTKPAAAKAAVKKSTAKSAGDRAALPDFIPPSLATLHDTAPAAPRGCTK